MPEENPPQQKVETNHQPSSTSPNTKKPDSDKGVSSAQNTQSTSNFSETPTFKRNIAFKLRIGQILEGKQNFDLDKLRCVLIDNKEVVRVNLIANITDKYVQDEEKKFASITLDDASGQIKVKTFGEDIQKFAPLNQGDTILVIGLLRSWNDEVYITPDILKKKSPQFLLVRKLEVEAETPKKVDSSNLQQLKDRIITMIKSSETNQGIEIDKMIMDLKEPPETINAEIKKLLEDGVIYEPRPGKLRYLG
jgi:RPA family protein